MTSPSIRTRFRSPPFRLSRHSVVPFVLVAMIAFTLTAISSRVQADTLRVPDHHQSIQSAIDAAAPGDMVLVTTGTYFERIRVHAGVTLRSEGDDDMGELGLKRSERTVIDGSKNEGKGSGVMMGEGAVLDGFTVTGIGHYDDAIWKRHDATQGQQQSHQQIGNPGTPGIQVTGVNCTIQNNIVHHIGSTGIAIQGVDGKRCSPQIHRNVCYRNMGGGIGSMRNSRAIIKENVCFENFHAGIGHNNASPIVIGNICYQNVRAGIGISEGSCPIVRGNKCYRNRRAGIGSRTGDGTRPVIEDNDCYENQMAGIGAEENASPIIRGNRCYRNRLAGIGARTHATPTIVGNECFENEQAGIGHEGDVVTTVIGNHCHHNNEAGIGFAACRRGVRW